MKLNKITNIALSGAFLLLGAVSFSSCADQNDWDVDSSYDRLFHTTSLSVSPDENSAEVTFDKTPNTTGYQVECSTAELTDDIALGEGEGSIVKTFTSSPATFDGLQAETTYYLRMRGINDEGKTSKWVYLEDKSFTTKAEQIINNVVDIKSSTATITLNTNKDLSNVTRIAWYHVSDGVENEEGSADVNGADLAAAGGTYTIEGLKSNFSYTVRVFAGDVKRGEYKFKTTENLPEGYKQLDWDANTTIATLLANTDESNVVIMLPQGATVDEGAIDIPANIQNIYFWGAEGSSKPTLMVKETKVQGDMGVIKFHNVNLAGKDNKGYVANIQGSHTIGSISFDNCTISNVTGVVRLQKIEGTGKVGDINIDNCVITNVANYGVVNTKSQPEGCVENINISNTTINGITGGDCISIQQKNANVKISYCTFFDCCDAKNIVNTNSQANIAEFENCLFAGSSVLTMKATSNKAGKFTECYYSSDMNWSAKPYPGTALDVTGVTLFPNYKNNDFHVAADCQDKVGQAGDPRWTK